MCSMSNPSASPSTLDQRPIRRVSQCRGWGIATRTGGGTLNRALKLFSRDGRKPIVPERRCLGTKRSPFAVGSVRQTGSKIRLPTEWEWQQAATGGDPRREYPWEGGRDRSRCNSYESRLNRTIAVGMYPHGATRNGIHDMVGNVEEWCLSGYEEPEQPEAVRTDKKIKQRVVRGGSWSLRPGNARVHRSGSGAAPACGTTALASVLPRTFPNPVPFVL